MPGLRVRLADKVGVIADDPLPNGFDVNSYLMVRFDGREPVPIDLSLLSPTD